MTPPATATFEHQALLYDDLDAFLAGVVPFIEEGLREEEAVMVAVGPERLALLPETLGDRAADVRLVDMHELGVNPGRLIPAWEAFLREHRRPGRGIRGVGEPIWAGRSSAALVECQLHESLLNLAFAEEENFQLLCPYDARALDPSVVREACCSHPTVVDHDGARASQGYRGADLLAPFDLPLPTPPVLTEIVAFDHEGLHEVRELVASRAQAAGIRGSRRDDLVLAVSEITVNSIFHGGGNGVLRVWLQDDRLVCEVRDRGRITDPLVGRHAPRPEQLSGYGVWLAHQVTDLVQLRSDAGGTVVRLHMRCP